MGLSVGYGQLAWLHEDPEGAEWFRQDQAEVNAVLRANGRPEHAEPDELPPHEPHRGDLGSIGYSWLHCLRRLHALVLQRPADDPAWRPTPAPAAYPGRDLDPIIDDELCVYIRSHLIVHSDTEGWYVPLDFEDILYDEPGTKLPGGMLGSTVRLLAELRSLAPWLGITLTAEGDLEDTEAARINALPDDSPWFREQTAWLHLFEVSRLSLALHTAVVFH